MTCFIGEMWYIVEREMWYIDSGLITTQHTTYYCYVTYDLCALYNVDLDLQNMLNHPDGVKAPKEILLLEQNRWRTCVPHQRSTRGLPLIVANGDNNSAETLSACC